MSEKLVNFELDVDIKTELDIISKRDGKTLKVIFNDFAREYVKIHKEGNEQHLLTSYTENEDFRGFPSMGIDYINKKNYIKKYLQKDGRLNRLGEELWGHIIQWQTELQKN